MVSLTFIEGKQSNSWKETVCFCKYSEHNLYKEEACFIHKSIYFSSPSFFPPLVFSIKEPYFNSVLQRLTNWLQYGQNVQYWISFPLNFLDLCKNINIMGCKCHTHASANLFSKNLFLILLVNWFEAEKEISPSGNIVSNRSHAGKNGSHFFLLCNSNCL
jgi:hypothetical protein